MCDKCQNNSNQAFVNGALIGGLVGAAIGFLYAPQSGTETRKKLKESAEAFKVKAEPYLDTIQDNFQEKVIPMLKEVQTASEPVRKELMEKIGQLVEEVEEKIVEEKKDAKKKFFSGLK